MKLAIWLLPVIVLVPFLLGCGGDLTGGSVPIGPSGLKGTVFQSSDTSSPVPGATVVLTTSQGQALETTSDQQGEFSFEEVPPGLATLVVVPPHATSLLPTSLTVEVTAGTVASSAVALEPSDPSISVSGVTVLPSNAVVQEGGSLHFEAKITGSGVTGLAPTWEVRGGIGRIAPDGTLVATQKGHGQVAASLRGVRGSASVRVE